MIVPLKLAQATLRALKKGELAHIEAMALVHEIAPPRWVNEGYEALRAPNVAVLPTLLACPSCGYVDGMLPQEGTNLLQCLVCDHSWGDPR